MRNALLALLLMTTPALADSGALGSEGSDVCLVTHRNPLVRQGYDYYAVVVGSQSVIAPGATSHGVASVGDGGTISVSASVTGAAPGTKKNPVKIIGKVAGNVLTIATFGYTLIGRLIPDKKSTPVSEPAVGVQRDVFDASPTCTPEQTALGVAHLVTALPSRMFGIFGR